MSAPQIPPRPLRAKHSAEAPRMAESFSQIPQVPPRPIGRHVDRPDSAARDSFAPSPLNDPPFLPKAGSGGSVYGSLGGNASSSNTSLPARPPSVTLPSIGQEGSEYADIVELGQEEPISKTISGTSETATSHVGSDLPLHAPKPSLSQSDQRARIQTVTRTDSDRAASVGVGRRASAHIDEPIRGLKSKSSASLRSPSVASTERPGSTQAEELGIPEIGVQVPMYPNAGDVQAPSPALPSSSSGPPTGGLYAERSRHHGRTRSGREIFHGPPGSYGLHGHGLNPTDKFEKAWYEKHPEALAQEGQYSPALSNIRGDYVLSSEDLNKLVQGTAKRGSGFGTAANVVGLPDEQIGYMASEEYAARMASRPTSSYATKAHGNHSETHIESPLRQATFPKDATGKVGAVSQDAAEPAPDDEPGVIHIGAPEHKYNKVTGEGTSTPTVDLGPRGGNTEYEGGYIDEQGYGVPILASDEIRPGSEWQKPAVSPIPDERRTSLNDIAARFGSQPGSATGSRPTSRPGSIHGYHSLSRFTSHEEHDLYTHLDDVEEYEPLFEDDEKTVKKPLTQAERLKHRPDMKRRFPSQDIWEDTPNSLQLQAEVQSPPPVEQAVPETQTSNAFETPEAEASRKGEVNEKEKTELLPKEVRLEKSNFKPHLREETHRPDLSQRFPSQDIWEDSPDSARLETTVSGEPLEQDEGLAAGAVVQTSALPSGASREGATSGASVQPMPPSSSGTLFSIEHVSTQNAKCDTFDLYPLDTSSNGGRSAHLENFDGSYVAAGSAEEQGIHEGAASGEVTKPADTMFSGAENSVYSKASQEISFAGGRRSTGTRPTHSNENVIGIVPSTTGSVEGEAVRKESAGSSPGAVGSIEGDEAHVRTISSSSIVAGSTPKQLPKDIEATAIFASKNPLSFSTQHDAVIVDTPGSVVPVLAVGKEGIAVTEAPNTTRIPNQPAPDNTVANQAVSTDSASNTMPTIPLRPSKQKDLSPDLTTHPTIPARPNKHSHQHNNHATSPHEQSRLSEVYTAPSQAAEGDQRQDSQISSPEDQRTSSTEGRKAPAIPQKPKPHAPQTGMPEPSTTHDAVAGDAQKVSSHSLTTSAADLPSIAPNSGAAAPQEIKGAATTRSEVATLPTTTKPKPAIPARPAGNKIAALQAGFMSDLNNRLKLGPQPHQKVPEPAEEKAEETVPLGDARKARAKGPTRRKPATSPSPAVAASTGTATDVQASSKIATSLTIFQPICVWEISPTGVLDPVYASVLSKDQRTASLDDAKEDTTSHSSGHPDTEPPATIESSAELPAATVDNETILSAPAEEPKETPHIEDADVQEITVAPHGGDVLERETSEDEPEASTES